MFYCFVCSDNTFINIPRRKGVPKDHITTIDITFYKHVYLCLLFYHMIKLKISDKAL